MSFSKCFECIVIKKILNRICGQKQIFMVVESFPHAMCIVTNSEFVGGSVTINRGESGIWKWKFKLSN